MRPRLRVLVTALFALASFLLIPAALAPSGTLLRQDGLKGSAPAVRADVPATGQAVPAFAGVDAAVVSMMQRYGIPGAALGLIHDGRLVYLRGYGYADQQAGLPVQPDARFRIASVSKPITAAAVLLLVDQGKLTLETPAFPLLDISPPPGKTPDPRISTITVRDLLTHQGGWDRYLSFDPMFRSRDAALALGMTPPADCATIIRWVLGFPLDFEPRTRVAYSNLGYCVLGRVIEKVTGMPYGAFVQQAILNPLGMTQTALGRTLQQLPGEVRYYDPPGNPLARSVFDDTPVPWPYGGFYLEAMDAHGGWVSTTSDVLRFLAAMNISRGQLLPSRLGAGIASVPLIGRAWFYEGALNGTRTILASDRKNGWALLTNTWRFDTDFDRVDPLWNDMKTAIEGVRSWPVGDLFPSTLGAGYGYVLSVTVSGASGTVTSAPAGIDCPGACRAPFLLGTSLTLTAKSRSPDQRFIGWGGGICAGTAPCAITVRADTTVSARFGPALHRVTVAVRGAGKILSRPAGIDCPRKCSARYTRGTIVVLRPVPANGWRLSRWTGTCKGNRSCSVPVKENALVGATFVRRR